MTVEPIGHIAVLEIKLSALTIREAMLEAAVQQLTLENTQHKMEINRIEDLLNPPADVENPDTEPAIEVTE